MLWTRFPSLYISKFSGGGGCPKTPLQTRASGARFQRPPHPLRNTLRRPCTDNERVEKNKGSGDRVNARRSLWKSTSLIYEEDEEGKYICFEKDEKRLKVHAWELGSLKHEKEAVTALKRVKKK